MHTADVLGKWKDATALRLRTGPNEYPHNMHMHIHTPKEKMHTYIHTYIHNADVLGKWKDGGALRLRTGPNEYPHWSGEANIPVNQIGDALRYKYIIVRYVHFFVYLRVCMHVCTHIGQERQTFL
jgi:hypothetical protein